LLKLTRYASFFAPLRELLLLQRKVSRKGAKAQKGAMAVFQTDS
jgi:hypothetical protein